MADVAAQFAALEAAIRVDPARRGLLADGATLGLGQLADAANNLAANGRDIAIVTGFGIPTPDGPLAETDGPPGAAMLADICRQLGMRVRLVTDAVCHNAVAVAARQIGIDPADVLACPLDRTAAADWCTDFLERSPDLTHLVAIERSGPSHTTTSLEAAAGVAVRDNYIAFVPLDSHDRPHNMRGEPIDAHTAPLHLLFEGAKGRSAAGAKEQRSKGAEGKLAEGTGEKRSAAPSRFSSDSVTQEKEADSSPFAPLPLCPSVPLSTIGIGDGGNEIGMGAFNWAALHPLIAGQHGRRIACRIATDWTIIAGTSNWGAFALAAAVACLRGRPDVLAPWTAERHRELLTALVHDGPAVDGVTREPTATVDGLPFLTYIQPWETMRGVTTSRPGSA